MMLIGGLAVGYLMTIVGAVGMIIFARRFPFSTSLKDLEHTDERFGPLNGYQVWVGSWALIVLGGVVQLVSSVGLALCQS